MIKSARTYPPDGKAVRGTTNLYGYAVGILMIEGYFPRPPGAIGNATTFPFPVLHRVVKGASGEATVRALAEMPSESPEFAAAVEPWIEGAQELERQGVRAITTSCGFTALFQRELAASVDIPVFATSLLLAPMIARSLKPGALVGVVTADARMLQARHLEGAGIDLSTVALIGLEHCPYFEEVTYRDRHELDLERMEHEIVSTARALVQREPAVRAILLECSLLPPYAAAIQRELRLPVFDFTHMITLMHSAMIRAPFAGFT